MGDNIIRNNRRYVTVLNQFDHHDGVMMSIKKDIKNIVNKVKVSFLAREYDHSYRTVTLRIVTVLFNVI